MALRVAVIGGGGSHEAEVSRSSASQVAEALECDFEVRNIELTANIAQDLGKFQPDVVFPVLHGAPGEDGTIQGLLTILGYPYVGCGVRASVLALDKVVAKQQFRAAGIPVLDELVATEANLQQSIEEIRQKFSDRVVCKPRFQGSALGTTLLPNGGDVVEALKRGFQYDEYMLVEPFVKGREITVGVLDLFGQDAIALPVTEILVAADEWYDFTNRYTPGRSEHVIPAEVDPQLYVRLQQAAIDAHKALGAEDLSRADFVLEPSGQFWILEVNSMPGMTPTSLYPDACRSEGLDLVELTTRFVEGALKRGLRTA
ncbi:MAG: D-alanine--D-alanine ligase [Gammaproteobacteria bacterium]|nr:D-alanine--D-alanine ligase [Gammaproteobacteria bacterium]